MRPRPLLTVALALSLVVSCSESDFPGVDPTPDPIENTDTPGGEDPENENPGGENPGDPEGEEPDGENPVPPLITVGMPEYPVPAAAGEIDVEFHSTKAWQASVDALSQEWCSIDPSSGESGDAVVRVTFFANDLYEERPAVITITSGTESETITVRQAQSDGLFMITPVDYAFFGQEEFIDVEFSANVDIAVHIDPSAGWITSVEPMPTRGLRENSFRFRIAGQDDPSWGAFRCGTITFAAGTMQETVTVNQGSTAFAYASLSAAERLEHIFSSGQLGTIDRLVVLGDILPADFAVIRDMMPALTYLNLENTSATAIPANAFYDPAALAGMTSLEEAILPAGLLSIGESAFRGCSSLATPVFPSTLTGIGAYAFFRCEGLLSVSLPDQVASVGKSAFMHCTQLTSAKLSDGMTVVPENLFFGCYNLGLAILPAQLATIEKGAFADCLLLKDIDFPGTLSTIGTESFKASGLLSADLPAGISDIGSGAFYMCSDLASVTCRASAPPSLGASAFGLISLSARLYVYPAYIDDYAGSPDWSAAFGDISGMSL